MSRIKKWARTPGEALGSYVPELPVKGAAVLTRLIFRLINLKCPAVFHYDFDKREMKDRPVLILAQHTSRDDPYYVNEAYPFVRPNAVMSMHNVLIPFMWRILLKDGVILKSLYEPDTKAIRHLMRLHRRGASILLFPEGIQSMDGVTEPLHPTTARLIKKLAMDTVLCTNHGAYLCNPRFDTNKRKGRLEYNFEILFRREEIEDMTEDELYSRLLEKFRYNDFAWNSEKQYRYKGKVALAHGLDNILFVCPHCGKQFTMKVEGDRLQCSCGRSVTVDDRYNLIPDDASDFPFSRIDEWYRWQRGIVAEEVCRDDFILSEDVTYLTLNMDDLRKGSAVPVGEGRIELDSKELRYIGTGCGEDTELSFDISRMPSLPLGKSMFNQFYYDGEYYRFDIHGDKRHAVKLMMAVEILHDMGDPERSRARSEAEAGWRRD